MTAKSGSAGRDPQTAAEEALREFEKRFELREVPPVPVERIASSLLDLLIEETEDVRSIPGAPTDQGRLSGMLVPETRTIWVDRVEAARSPGRRRFTIAHECGHWVLHVLGSGSEVWCRRKMCQSRTSRTATESVICVSARPRPTRSRVRC